MKSNFLLKNKALLVSLLIGFGTVFTSAMLIEPANAQDASADSGIEDVEDTVDSLGSVAGGATGVVLLSLGVRLAIKQVNRIMTKG